VTQVIILHSMILLVVAYSYQYMPTTVRLIQRRYVGAFKDLLIIQILLNVRDVYILRRTDMLTRTLP
jgi:hypothetical protein